MKIIDFSKLKKKLPSYPVLIDGDEYFNSSVLITIAKIKDEHCFIFEKRAVGIRQGGEISFPGGEVDKKEDASNLETAIRETVEELGIKREKIKVVGQLGILMIPGVLVNAFIAEVDIQNLDEVNFDKTEVERVFAVPISFFKRNPPEVHHVRLEAHPFYIDNDGNKVELLPVEKLNLPPRYSKPWGKIKRKVYFYNYDGEVIWGLTAALVKKVVEMI